LRVDLIIVSLDKRYVFVAQKFKMNVILQAIFILFQVQAFLLFINKLYVYVFTYFVI